MTTTLSIHDITCTIYDLSSTVYESPFNICVTSHNAWISDFSTKTKLCGIQDSASPPHAIITLPQAVIQKMESLALQ